MSADKNHSEQFERYLKGQMTPQEAHAFEREVLDDPFAQEALDGYESAGVESLNDVSSLKKQVTQNQRGSLPFLRIAAVVTLLIIGSFTVYQFTNQIEGEKLAMDEESIDEIVQSSPAPDTLSTAATEKEEELQVAEEAQLADEEAFSKMEIKDDDRQEVPLLLADELTEDDAEVTEEIEIIAAEKDQEVINETSFAGDLQGRAVGLEVAPAEIILEPSTDTTIHEQVIVAADMFFDEEEAQKDETVLFKTTEEAKATKKARTGAVSRSAGASDSQVLVGRVTNESGDPLPGVTVVIKGTTTGATTNLDGFFELPKSENQVLAISYVGFESQEIEVGNRSYIEASLGGSVELQEVVVTSESVERNDAALGYSAAKPVEGTREFKKYLEENLQYPESARTNEIEGTVVLELTINELGTVTDISVKRSLGYGCDQEAIRLISEGPRWEPAEKDGNKVYDKIRVRVKFKLDR